MVSASKLALAMLFFNKSVQDLASCSLTLFHCRKLHLAESVALNWPCFALLFEFSRQIHLHELQVAARKSY